jgi:hypothetical protein
MRTFAEFLAEQRIEKPAPVTVAEPIEETVTKVPPCGDRFIWQSDAIEWHTDEDTLFELEDRPAKHKDLDLSRSDKWEFHDHPSMADHQLNHSRLTDAHKASIAKYKSGSTSFNQHLRGKSDGPGPEAHHFHNLDHVASHSLTHDHVLYRGGHPDNHTQFRPGREFTEHGYTSTSLKPGVAADYAREHGYNERKVIHVIHAPAGTKGHYLDVHKAGAKKPHENVDEHEVLLQRGTRYKVTHHTMDSNAHYIHMKVVGQHPNPVHEQRITTLGDVFGMKKPGDIEILSEKFAGPHREKSPAHSTFTKSGFKHLSTKDHSSGRKIHKYWSNAQHLDHGAMAGHMSDAGYEKHGHGQNVTVYKHKSREHDEVRVISSPGNHDIIHSRA